jgi:hypothetical protein
MKYTFMSKWTVLLLTIATFALAVWSYTLTFSQVHFTIAGQSITIGSNQHPGWGVFVFLISLLIYAFAWLLALLDSLQERKFGWSVGLFLLLPFWIGPLLYGLIGPRNTR